MSVTVYHYPNCSTCKKALAWLDAHEIEHTRVDIVKQPPSVTVLKQARELSGAPLKKLFNTSGLVYRGEDWKSRIDTVSDAEALEALSANGKLIKRPLLVGDDVALIGFKEDAYAATFGG